MKDKQATGKHGEQLAAQFLEKKGYIITGRNVRTPYGEIDLIAEKHLEIDSYHPSVEPLIVFVEVKTRTTHSLGPPEIAVSRRKRAHLIASIQYYMQEIEKRNAVWRADVIAVEIIRSDGDIQIIHFENAISE